MKMRKNKIFIYLFMWLLLIVASSVHADEVNGIVAMDTWEFMKDKLTPDEYARFKSVYGDSEENFNKETYETHQKQQEEDLEDLMLMQNLMAGSSVDVAITSQQSKSQGDKIKEQQECYGAKNGGMYCINENKNSFSVEAASAEGEGCGIVEVHWYNNRRCLFCPLIGVIYNVVDKITVVSYNYLGRSFAILAVVILLLWLAVKTLVFVSSMAKQDAAKYLTECIQQIYKFLIAFFALVYFGNIFRYILSPLLGAALSFGTIIAGGGDLDERLGAEVASQVARNDVEALAKAGDTIPEAYKDNLDNAYFGLSTLANLEHLVYSVNSNYSLIQTIGSRLMCLSGKLVLKLKFSIAIACFINGVVFFITGLFLGIAFAFYLLDAVVQLGMVGALLPLMIASWPFKITIKYTTNGFKMFLNSLFTFMMVAVICSVSIELINQAVGGNATGGVAPNGGFKGLVDAINDFDIEELKKRVNVLSMGFIVIIFACLTSFLLMQKVGEVINKFASGGLKPAAPEIGGMAASAAKGAATKIAAPTAKAVKEKAKEKVKAAPGAAKNLVKKIGRKVGMC